MNKTNPIERRRYAWMKCWHCPKNKPVKNYDPFTSPEQKCNPHVRRPEECELAFLKAIQVQNRFEVVVLYGWSKFDPLGVYSLEKLAELVYSHAQKTDQYGREFEILILGRSLKHQNSTSHYVCRGGKVVRWYESSVGMNFPTSETPG